MGLAEYLQQIDQVAPPLEGAVRTVDVDGFKLQLPPGVWDPSRGKGSPAFRELLQDYPLEGIHTALDLGTGSGILALLLKRRGVPTVVAADQSAESIRAAAENFKTNGHPDIREVQANLFDGIEGVFDLVTFNAPATHPLRRKEAEQMPTLWSPEANIVRRFLEQWRSHKTPNGKALVMCSQFIDFDPLEDETVEAFQMQYLKQMKGEFSTSGIVEFRS